MGGLPWVVGKHWQPCHMRVCSDDIMILIPCSIAIAIALFFGNDVHCHDTIIDFICFFLSAFLVPMEFFSFVFEIHVKDPHRDSGM